MAIEISPGGPRFSPSKSIFIKQPGIPNTEWKNIGATVKQIIVDERAEYPLDFSDVDMVFTMPPTKKNRRALKRMKRAIGKPAKFKIMYGSMPFWSRIKVWSVIVWAKLRHKPCLIERNGRALMFPDINDAL